MLTELEFVKKMTFGLCSLNIESARISENDILEYIKKELKNILPQRYLQTAFLNKSSYIESEQIYVFENMLNVHIAFFYMGEQKRLVIIGPCRNEDYSQRELIEFLDHIGANESEGMRAVSAVNALPPLSINRLKSTAELIFAHLLKGDIREARVMSFLTPFISDSEQSDINTFEEISTIKNIESRYEASAALTEAVKMGNEALAMRFISRLKTMPDELVRNPNVLRNAQNLAIILNTQLRHALEESGVHPYRLDRLSGSIAREIETLKSKAAVQTFLAEIIRRYCALSQQRDSFEHTAFARLCISYIKSHLSDSLTVKEVASELRLTPNYLSYKFKEDVGENFIDFVNRERINQAAALLKRTDMQIGEISSAVGFSSSSYFTLMFKRFMGISPRAFRGSKN